MNMNKIGDDRNRDKWITLYIDISIVSLILGILLSISLYPFIKYDVLYIFTAMFYVSSTFILVSVIHLFINYVRIKEKKNKQRKINI